VLMALLGCESVPGSRLRFSIRCGPWRILGGASNRAKTWSTSCSVTFCAGVRGGMRVALAAHDKVFADGDW